MEMDKNLLQIFGINALLSEQDDPLLWEAALAAHWKLPDDPSCLVNTLRFDIGRRLAEGEIAQGEPNSLHAVQRGMVDIQEWCFERVDDTHLCAKACPEIGPVVVAMPLSISSMMSLGETSQIPVALPSMSITLGISRPSLETGKAVVYAGFSAPGVGQGDTYIWKRQTDGRWEQTPQRTAWWIT
jgi:hypothetical protein